MRADFSAYLSERADLLMRNVAGWEAGVLKRLAVRIGKIGKLSEADAKALNNIAIARTDMKAVLSDLSKMSAQNIASVERIYHDAVEREHLENKLLYKYRGVPFHPIDDNPHLKAIVSAFARETAGTMLNLSSTSVLCTLDAAGNVVGWTAAYQDAIDKAIMAVTTGATDFHAAMRDTIRAIGGNGIRVAYSGSGITRRLDTAVRQSVMWGGKQVGNEYSRMIGEELDCDGIEIDYHSSPRPSHEFMQGQQYHKGGDIVIDGVLFKDSGEAEERLQDYNCYHYATPIICGVSTPRYDAEELRRLKAADEAEYTIGDKSQTRYGWTQDMRKLETATRQEKTIRDMAIASGDKELASECRERIAAYKEKYLEICNGAGLSPDYSRMSITRPEK